MAFNACIIPPLPASAVTLGSVMPLSLTSTDTGKPPKDIEFYYAWYRALRKVSYVVNGASASFLFPRANFYLAAGTITGITGTPTSTVITDSDATYTGSVGRCGIPTALTSCYIQIYYKDDPRYVAKSTITASTSTTLTLNTADWIARGICTSLTDLVGSQYCIYANGDIGSYDRWFEPPNSFEYVSNPAITATGLPGSLALFPTAQVAFSGSITAGTYTLTVTTTSGTQTTTAIPYNASGSDIQTAIQALSNVGGGNALIVGYQNKASIAFDPSLGSTSVSATSSLTGGSVSITTLSNTLVDPLQQWAVNQWITAQPTYPNNPSTFDLVINDDGANGDNLVHRLSITSNDGMSIVTGSLGGWVPSLNCYYSIIHSGGIWNPKALSAPRKVWYRGAMTGNGYTHWPDDSIGQYPVAGNFVSFDGGDTAGGASSCMGATDYNAFDIDVWNDCCDQWCCSQGNKSFTPDFYKTVRNGIQLAIQDLCQAPWINPNFTGGTSAAPITLTFPVACQLAHSAGSDINSFTGLITGISGSKAYVNFAPPHPTPTVYYTLFKPDGTIDVDGSSVVSTDGTGNYITNDGGWNSSQVGESMICTYGWSNSFDYGFMYLTPKTVWIPSLDSDGNAVVPPAFIYDPDTMVATPYFGSYQTRGASTNYVRYDLDRGLPDQSGPVFTEGDLAEYLGDNAADPTLPLYASASPLMQYHDHAYTGKCGPTPPNTSYQNSDSNGTAKGAVVSFANTSGLTTQMTTSANNWFLTWYNPGDGFSTSGGTASGGSSTTLVDSSVAGSTFIAGGVSALGATLIVTHISGGAPTTTTVTITGENDTTGTLTFAALGSWTGPVSGDTYQINYSFGAGAIYKDTGTASGGSSTTLVSSDHIGSALFAPGFYDLGYTLVVTHVAGGGATTVTKALITAVDASTGTLTFQVVDGWSGPVSGDTWEIDWPYELNRWQQYRIVVSIPAIGASPASNVTVVAQANDQNTLFIYPQSGFTLTSAMITAGVTIKSISFDCGSVLKYDGTYWNAPTGTDNRPDPNNGGTKPPFSPDLTANLPFRFDWYGPIHRGTYWSIQWWNQLWFVLLTLQKRSWNVYWDNKGENNFFEGEFANYYWTKDQINDFSSSGGWLSDYNITSIYGYTTPLSGVDGGPFAWAGMDGFQTCADHTDYNTDTYAEAAYFYGKSFAPTYCSNIALTIDCYDYGMNPCAIVTDPHTTCTFNDNGQPVVVGAWTLFGSLDVTTNITTPYYTDQVGSNAEPSLPDVSTWPTSDTMDAAAPVPNDCSNPTVTVSSEAGYYMSETILSVIDWSSVLTY